MSTSEESTSNVKEIAPTGNIRTLSFAVALPQSIFEDRPPAHAAALGDDKGIVGTITLFPNASMVWFGWGSVLTAATTTTDEAVDGSGVPTHMGPMLAAFPRTAYQGLSGEGSVSQLIGSEHGDDAGMCHQMASRLSQTLKQPVFCSCSLSEGTDWMAGLDQSAVTQRAAALAERTVRKLLIKEQQQQASN